MKTTNACAIRAGKAVASIGYAALGRRLHLDVDASQDFRRMFKRTQRAAVDLVEDAAFVVKKQPLQSLGAAFGTAFILGAVAGHFVRR